MFHLIERLINSFLAKKQLFEIQIALFRYYDFRYIKHLCLLYLNRCLFISDLSRSDFTYNISNSPLTLFLLFSFLSQVLSRHVWYFNRLYYLASALLYDCQSIF